MHAVGLMKMASESPITRFEGRHELYPYCSLAQSAVAGSGAFPPAVRRFGLVYIPGHRSNA